MSDTINILLERVNIDEPLLDVLHKRSESTARSHGNYINALDTVIKLIEKDRYQNSQILIIFLSDGAPSDHNNMKCSHGIHVWQTDPRHIPVKLKGTSKFQLLQCTCSFSSSSSNSQCRHLLKQKVTRECITRIIKIGKRDCIVYTVLHAVLYALLYTIMVYFIY